MDLAQQRSLNRRSRQEFLRQYIQWVWKVDNRTWSTQQAVLVNAYVENANNFLMSREAYLGLKGELRGLRKIA